MIDEPVHVRVGQIQPVGELATGVALGRHVGDGIDQHLQAGRDLVVAHLLRDDRTQVSARAVAGHRDAVGTHAPTRRLGDGEPPRGERVVDRGGEGMLGREPVVDREDVGPGGQRQPADEVVVADPIPLDEAAAVEEHDEPDRIDLGAVTGSRDRPARPVDLEILLDGHRRQLLGQGGRVLGEVGPGAIDRLPGELEGAKVRGDPPGQRHLRREPLPVGVDATELCAEAQQGGREVSGTAHEDALDTGRDRRRRRCGLTHARERTRGARSRHPRPPVSDSLPCPTA